MNHQSGPIIHFWIAVLLGLAVFWSFAIGFVWALITLLS